MRPTLYLGCLLVAVSSALVAAPAQAQEADETRSAGSATAPAVPALSPPLSGPSDRAPLGFARRLSPGGAAPLFASGPQAGGSSSTPRILSEAAFGFFGAVIAGIGTGALTYAATLPFRTSDPYGIQAGSTAIVGTTIGYLGFMPVGVHIAGRRFDEDGRLGMAYLGEGLGLVGGLLVGGAFLAASPPGRSGTSVGVVGFTAATALGPLFGAITGWENSRSAASGGSNSSPPR